MGGKAINLLIIEDSEDDAFLITRDLKRFGFEVASQRVDTEETVKSALAAGRWDIVISDFNMPKLTGFRALELVREAALDLPFILLSGSIGEDLAVKAMKAGAQDYLMKDNLARLGSAVTREIGEAHERRKRREAETELKEKNKQLIVAQRMEAIGRLAGGIAHDLNNMIGACTLYAEIALDPAQGLDAVRENVREIIKAQERATLLVRQLLTFSRKQVIDPQIVSVNQVIDGVHKMLSQILGEDVELVLDLESSLRPILADPSQIDQVIMNLVVNARDAMPRGGRLTIQTANETLAADPELAAGAYTRLTVTDTGTGIEESVRARIFEPFFTTKEIGKGTGLGLATVYGIVRQAGGDVRVRSQLGVGTSFDILMKATDAPHSIEPDLDASTPAPSRPLTQKTLLLVEDDPSVRKALNKALSQLGYQLHVAADGEEAMRLFEVHRDAIDLLVSDVVMPKMSGPDLATELRKRSPALKVLFLSGHDHDMLASYGIDQKGTFLLSKPFSMRQLAAKIAEIISNSHIH